MPHKSGKQLQSQMYVHSAFRAQSEGRALLSLNNARRFLKPKAVIFKQKCALLDPKLKHN